MAKQKICVIASGGDAPGMNACMEAIFRFASPDISVYAGIDGFDGLIDGNFVQLTLENTRGISQRSGCEFRCGRSKRLMTKDGFAAAIKNYKKQGFTALVVIGGNGSFIGAGRCKNARVNTIFIPATIDNDVEYTMNCLGFSSACEDSVVQIDKFKETMETSRRDYVVKVMGRNCNRLAKHIGEASFADVIDMEGDRHTPKQIADIFVKNRAEGKESSFCVFQEKKAETQFAEIMEAATFVKQIGEAMGNDKIRLCTLGYMQRGARPSYHDRYLGTSYGARAVECIKEGNFGICLGFKDEGVFVTDLPLAPVPNA
ncbi:MAG: 6-phosphofructokinase [Firmicutes bacterium]|nr:6-phosphofructokinase [Bacillota bacterium]